MWRPIPYSLPPLDLPSDLLNGNQLALHEEDLARCHPEIPPLLATNQVIKLSRLSGCFVNL